MKRPLLMVALLYAAGIILADLSTVSLPVFFLLGTAAGLALLSIAWPKARPALLLALLPLAGAANLAFRVSVLAPHDLRKLLGEQPAIVWVRGQLVETPYSRVNEHGADESWRALGQLDVSEVRLQGRDWQPAFGRVVVSTPGVLGENFFGGREVEIDGTLRPPRRAVAEGLFDYAQYLRRQGIYFQLVVASTNDWRVVQGGPMVKRPLADRFGDWAKTMLARGLPTEDEPLHLLWTMTLGWKTALTGEVSEPFMRSGTMHVFAISGLHIALISGILIAALRVFRVARFACGLIAIPFIWTHTGFTGWQASAIRSTIMMTVIIAGWSLRRPSDLLNSLAAAAFIILLLDPRQLFQASFQLSFSVVLSLALFIPVLEAIRRKLLRYDPLVPDELRSRWQRWARPPLDYVSSGLTTSLAAWLGSIPLVAYYFHLFTPVSLLANLIVVPLSSLALACAMGSLFVGAGIPLAADLFNNSAWLFMWLMVRVSQWCAQLPGSWLHVASPSALGFVLYYALLVSAMAGWLASPRLRRWVGGALAVVASLWTLEFLRDAPMTRVAVLPLNGGEAVYFKAAGGEKLLIDCGDVSSFEFVVKPFLRGQGVNRLDNLLLTHGDIRNVGGALAAEEVFPPRKVFLNAASFRSAIYRQVRAHFEKRTGLSQPLRRGDAVGPWHVLHPDAKDAFTQADDETLVLRAEIDGFAVLLLSDLGKPGQSGLLERYPQLRADVVIAGLPVQGEPLAEALLDAMEAQAIVVTDSEYPATARAGRKLQERLAARHMPVLYTGEAGAVTVSLRRGRCEVRAWNGTRLELRPRASALANAGAAARTERNP
jgi:ComEC/Rec2-related protein